MLLISTNNLSQYSSILVDPKRLQSYNPFFKFHYLRFNIVYFNTDDFKLANSYWLGH